MASRCPSGASSGVTGALSSSQPAQHLADAVDPKELPSGTAAGAMGQDALCRNREGAVKRPVVKPDCLRYYYRLASYGRASNIEGIGGQHTIRGYPQEIAGAACTAAVSADMTRVGSPPSSEPI